MSPTFSKRPLPLYALDGGEPALDFAHRWWRSRRDGSRLPSRAEVDDWAFRLLLAGARWIDVRSPESAEWSLAPLAGWLGKLPDAARSELEVSLRDDCRAARRDGVVLAQDLAVAGRGGGWRQLVLPHADDGVNVLDLLVVTAARPRAGAARPPRAATGGAR